MRIENSIWTIVLVLMIFGIVYALLKEPMPFVADLIQIFIIITAPVLGVVLHQYINKRKRDCFPFFLYKLNKPKKLNKFNIRISNNTRNILMIGLIVFVVLIICIVVAKPYLNSLEFANIKGLPQEIILIENVTNNPTIFIGSITISSEQHVINRIADINFHLYVIDLIVIICYILIGGFISYFISKKYK